MSLLPVAKLTEMQELCERILQLICILNTHHHPPLSRQMNEKTVSLSRALFHPLTEQERHTHRLHSVGWWLKCSVHNYSTGQINYSLDGREII